MRARVIVNALLGVVAFSVAESAWTAQKRFVMSAGPDTLQGSVDDVAPGDPEIGSPVFLTAARQKRHESRIVTGTLEIPNQLNLTEWRALSSDQKYWPTIYVLLAGARPGDKPRLVISTYSRARWYHHYSLSGGKSVLAAGRFVAIEGKLIAADAVSPFYAQDDTARTQLLDYLRSEGYSTEWEGADRPFLWGEKSVDRILKELARSGHVTVKEWFFAGKMQGKVARKIASGNGQPEPQNCIEFLRPYSVSMNASSNEQ